MNFQRPRSILKVIYPAKLPPSFRFTELLRKFLAFATWGPFLKKTLSPQLSDSKREKDDVGIVINEFKFICRLYRIFQTGTGIFFRV